MTETEPIVPPPEPTDRRGFLQRLGVALFGGLVALIVLIPGVAYVLDPLRRSRKSGDFSSLARLNELAEGVPRSFLVHREKQDAWVKYPEVPIGTVWLIRQPKGAKEPVVAFTARCPHAGCPIDLAADGKAFVCPCHKSSFTLAGKPENAIPPRPMDTLQVEAIDPTDPQAEIRVKFQVFRTKEAEKIVDA